MQHHWHKYSQVQRGAEKPTRKLPFIQRFGVMRRPTTRKKVRFKSRMSDIDSPKFQNSVFKWLAKPKVTINGDLWYEGKAVTPPTVVGRKRWRENLQEGDPLSPSVDAGWGKTDPFSKMTGALKST
ncbi:splicing factor 3B subunit 2 [Trichonephila clavipes]|nr:splicing factor 3B subunit 2 [Trichonephila clavipes]